MENRSTGVLEYWSIAKTQPPFANTAINHRTFENDQSLAYLSRNNPAGGCDVGLVWALQ
jgi:hypothetical protein